MKEQVSVPVQGAQPLGPCRSQIDVAVDPISVAILKCGTPLAGKDRRPSPDAAVLAHDLQTIQLRFGRAALSRIPAITTQRRNTSSNAWSSTAPHTGRLSQTALSALNTSPSMIL